MATQQKNNRALTTTFTLKDVVVVVAAMLTAVAPLIANDAKFDSIRRDVNAIEKHSDTIIVNRLKIEELTDRIRRNEDRMRQQQLEIDSLKEKLKK